MTTLSSNSTVFDFVSVKPSFCFTLGTERHIVLGAQKVLKFVSDVALQRTSHPCQEDHKDMAKYRAISPLEETPDLMDSLFDPSVFQFETDLDDRDSSDTAPLVENRDAAARGVAKGATKLFSSMFQRSKMYTAKPKDKITKGFKDLQPRRAAQEKTHCSLNELEMLTLQLEAKEAQISALKLRNCELRVAKTTLEKVVRFLRQELQQNKAENTTLNSVILSHKSKNTGCEVHRCDASRIQEVEKMLFENKLTIEHLRQELLAQKERAEAERLNATSKVAQMKATFDILRAEQHEKMAALQTKVQDVSKENAWLKLDNVALRDIHIMLEDNVSKLEDALESQRSRNDASERNKSKRRTTRAPSHDKKTQLQDTKPYLHEDFEKVKKTVQKVTKTFQTKLNKVKERVKSNVKASGQQFCKKLYYEKVPE